MRKAFKIVRNIIFTAVLSAAALYVLLYIALSLPFIQNFVKEEACKELNRFTGGTFSIESVSIHPFNKLILEGVNLKDPQGNQVASIDKVGAGIAIWQLIIERRITITFAELIGLDGKIVQAHEGGTTNIQFLIDAFASKDKNKPPTRFNLRINNIVIRRCNVSFDRLWQPAGEAGQFNPNHVHLQDLAADLRLPVLKNDVYVVDLRRMAFKEASGLTVENLQGTFAINNQQINATNLELRMPGTLINPSDIQIKINGFSHLKEDVLANRLHLSLSKARITPADFAPLLPTLKKYRGVVTIDADVDYHLGNLSVARLTMNMQEGVQLNLRGTLRCIDRGRDAMSFDLPMLHLVADGEALNNIVTDFVPLPENAIAIIRRLGSIKLETTAHGSLNSIASRITLESTPGTALIDAKLRHSGSLYNLSADVTTPGFELGSLLDNNNIGRVALTASADIALSHRRLPDGDIEAEVPLFTFNGYPYTALSATLSKQGTFMSGEVNMADPNLDFFISGEADLQCNTPLLNVEGSVNYLNLTPLNLHTDHSDSALRGTFDISLSGNNLDNLDGYAYITDFQFSNSRFKDISLNEVRLDCNHRELPYTLSLTSDPMDFSLTGDFSFADLPGSLRNLAAHFLPTLVGRDLKARGSTQAFDWTLRVKHDTPLLALLHLPVTLLEDLEISGACNSREGTASVLMDIPYLQQGKDKLIKDTHLALNVDTASNLCNLLLSTHIPSQKGTVSLSLDTRASHDSLLTAINWDLGRPTRYKGQVSLTSLFQEKHEGSLPVKVLVNPSAFEVNDTVWQIDPASLFWSGHSLLVDNIRVHRVGQEAVIDGVASASDDEALNISLSDIDLDYVFETLNINYVTFGGRASGVVNGYGLLSKTPRIYTDALNVHALTYNGSLLGDALISSYLNTRDMAVHINADIRERLRHTATVDGDIFVTRDSLSIGIEADSVNVGFLQPFMAAFSSQVEGRASGRVKLFGTFKDIDLVGRVHADTLRMKIDVTNTWYSACDSVIIDPGIIRLSGITLRDRDGHTAMLNGEVKHTYFHEPTFDFAISNARNFLCYDTDASINPIWWGTIYGNGSGKMHGVPGYIGIEVNMSSAPGSTFTFVLDDKEEAVDYEFLTFTDRRREAEEERIRVQMQPEVDEPEFLKKFFKRKQEEEMASRTRYDMDLRMTATPDAKVTIVMDPVAGDRIVATGAGSLRMTYNSEDELNLYGTYTLAQGSYNFTLQDLIVRDFIIKEGSKISFNGDPLRAILSLTAAYRVNTSLTELDKSFATDRELNRTNVPVEALLKVDGLMQSPEISFDIDFPTLSADVARKVKSIISTSDMMNRQIVYLLALNRFYTPDYMNTEGSNGELASVASTTVSTQLGQMLGQLAPGWTFSPYFRTEKGDFSDMEVDLALSSALFNNRLILNGNLGYRDASTSNTNFVGDFDIEYLLNPSGTLRLRAYNHFNDQNYYLRSALTTQGLGIVYKRDFNRFLPGIFRRRKSTTTPADSTRNQNAK